MTYGERQEAAARALLTLLSAPVDSQDGAAILQCRHQILLTLTERAEHLGGDPAPRRSPRRVSFTQVARQPLAELVLVLGGLPQMQAPAEAPTDVLGRRAGESGASASWRDAARELFLATSELVRSEHQPWTYRDSAGWYVVADLADTVGSLLALDRRLVKARILPALPRATSVEQLLITGDVSRLSRSWGDDPSADLAIGSPSTAFAGDQLPIQLVRTPTDLILAQQRLASMVHPIRANSDPRSLGERPGLKAGRALAVGQVRLGLRCVQWSEALGSPSLVGHFQARIQLYRVLHASTTRVIDTMPARSVLPQLQQSEIVTQLRGMNTAPNLDVLTRLNAASHQVAVAAGKALRREGLHAGHIQALVARNDGLPVPSPLSDTRHPFNQACADLANEPPPDAASTGPCHIHRDRLATGLSQISSNLIRPSRRLPADR